MFPFVGLPFRFTQLSDPLSQSFKSFSTLKHQSPDDIFFDLQITFVGSSFKLPLGQLKYLVNALIGVRIQLDGDGRVSSGHLGQRVLHSPGGVRQPWFCSFYSSVHLHSKINA